MSQKPVVLFNKNLADEWKRIAEGMKKEEWRVRYVESTQATPGDITFTKSNITFLCLTSKNWELLTLDAQKHELIRQCVERQSSEYSPSK
ncbi:hypothetical protein G9A89_007917 [Geosiphon pyriformis]|nr:hypothetical protein G9A89_007917 [Geosiphon pyriformis]